jgi:hypothetical protein
MDGITRRELPARQVERDSGRLGQCKAEARGADAAIRHVPAIMMSRRRRDIMLRVMRGSSLRRMAGGCVQWRCERNRHSQRHRPNQRQGNDEIRQ